MTRLVIALLCALYGDQASAVADCPMLMTQDVNLVAQMLQSKATMLFLGKIRGQQFVGDIARIDDPSDGGEVDITYSVEKAFRGVTGSTITLRTPFNCEACTITNRRELKEDLDVGLGKTYIVFVYEKIESGGRRTRVVSGGCELLDARSGSGQALVTALERTFQQAERGLSLPRR